uniref:Uncharacterized protein n=1 Tax=Cucumis sativus TaxID=3659 RepID=A0A0A0L992_CUCSA
MLMGFGSKHYINFVFEKTPKIHPSPSSLSPNLFILCLSPASPLNNFSSSWLRTLKFLLLLLLLLLLDGN